MFKELLIKGMPHDRAGEDFIAFLRKNLGFSDFKIVHYQSSKRQKVVLLRFKGKKNYLLNKFLRFKHLEIKLVQHIRPIFRAILMVKEAHQEARRRCQPIPEMQSLASVHLNNLSGKVTKAHIFEKLSQFGAIAKIKIYEKGEKKNKKKLKCRLVIVNFQTILGAIEAFYMDKMEFFGIPIKLKFYLTQEKIEDWLINQKKKIKAEESQQQEIPMRFGFRQNGALHSYKGSHHCLAQKNYLWHHSSIRQKIKTGFVKLRKNLKIERIEEPKETENFRLNLLVSTRKTDYPMEKLDTLGAAKI